jgi:hypothetical protein
MAYQTPDETIDAMSDGEFYHYMLDKNCYEWARQARRKLNLAISDDQEEGLAGYFASCAMAIIDAPNAKAIRARLDAEAAEDLQKSESN